MKHIKLHWLLLLALAAPFGAAAQAGGSAAGETQLEQGKQLYQYWCSACHAPGPGHPGTQALEARLQGSMPAVLEERTNLTPALVEVFVRNGISIMPFFRRTEINDEELAAIGADWSHNPGE